MRRRWSIFFLALFLSIPGLHADNGAVYRIIVNAKNPVESVDRKFLADAYLKKVTHWPDGGVIQPVDLRPGSATRRRFCEDILDRSVMNVKNYWQQAIFSGRDVPPPEFANEEEVIHYVGKNPASIGYVSNSTLSSDNPTGIKTVNLR